MLGVFVNTQTMITPTQIRMARAALGWGVRELAKRARLSPNTVSRIENGAGALAETLQLMQEAFERAGVEFIPGDATKGPGVRLTQSERTSRHNGVRSVQAIRLGEWPQLQNEAKYASAKPHKGVQAERSG